MSLSYLFFTFLLLFLLRPLFLSHSTFIQTLPFPSLSLFTYPSSLLFSLSLSPSSAESGDDKDGSRKTSSCWVRASKSLCNIGLCASDRARPMCIWLNSRVDTMTKRRVSSHSTSPLLHSLLLLISIIIIITIISYCYHYHQNWCYFIITILYHHHVGHCC